MAQWVNVLAMQASYLIPQAYMVERESKPHKVFLWPPHECVHIHIEYNNDNPSKITNTNKMVQ